MATTKRKVVAEKVEIKPNPPSRRRVLEEVEAPPELSYFAKAMKSALQYVSSGSAVMDAVLGGGWVLGRVANIVGDRSAGKTLLAIEATANFHFSYPDGLVRYAEAESAFDENYAGALGMPLGVVDFGRASTFGRGDEDEPLRTVEDWYESMDKFLAKCKKENKPGLYILDSFDALSDAAEMEREIDKGSFGQGKAKKSGELFRKLIDRIEESNVLLIVVSQIRDKMNVTFGETKTRAGGRALDFYASHIVWLAEIGKIKKTIQGLERPIGVNVRASCKKNKVGLPFRTCDYPILFGYGIDDLTANVEWLLENNGADVLKEQFEMSKAGYKIRIANIRDKGGEPVREMRAKLREAVFQRWQEIETGFLPKARKY